MKQNILIVDDDSDVLSALNLLLKSEGYQPSMVTSPAQVLPALREQDFSLVLADLNYTQDTTSGEEGLKLIEDIRKFDEQLPIVVMTGWATIDVAVDSLKRGANDFLQKPWDNDRLISILRTQLELSRSRKNSQKLHRQNQILHEEACLGAELVFRSEAIQQVLHTLERVAATDASVLLTGENGTGKSVFARYLHQLSLRREAPFISVNMGAIPDSLFESEMFGHVKGAFTDAKSSRIGRFEVADGGTLFLDEIANIPLAQQAKLLRVLEEMKFEKVGASKTQTVDTRLVTATNANLPEAVQQARFRQDLLFRINTVEVEIPPLRERKADIIPLADMFLNKITKKYAKAQLTLHKSACELLKAYAWPGNVRELSHVMERATILCQDTCIRDHDLGLATPTPTTLPQASAKPNPESLTQTLEPLEAIEKQLIAERLDYFEGDALQAAESLGLSRSAFYRRLGKIKPQ